jgi:hypothetical protein
MPNAPGWYPDPTGRPVPRWWNGTAWTQDVALPPPGHPGPFDTARYRPAMCLHCPRSGGGTDAGHSPSSPPSSPSWCCWASSALRSSPGRGQGRTRRKRCSLLRIRAADPTHSRPRRERAAPRRPDRLRRRNRRRFPRQPTHPRTVPGSCRTRSGGNSRTRRTTCSTSRVTRHSSATHTTNWAVACRFSTTTGRFATRMLRRVNE